MENTIINNNISTVEEWVVTILRVFRRRSRIGTGAAEGFNQVTELFARWFSSKHKPVPAIKYKTRYDPNPFFTFFFPFLKEEKIKNEREMEGWWGKKEIPKGDGGEDSGCRNSV